MGKIFTMHENLSYALNLKDKSFIESKSWIKSNFRKLIRQSKVLITLLLLLSSFTLVKAQVSSYSFAQSTNSYNAITGTTVHASGWDDAIVSAAIPFTFTFNGIGYTSCSVNSNGYITFGTTVSSTTGYTPISATTGYAGAVSAFGRDLISNASTVVSTTSGSTPNRIFIVQWNSARRYSGGALADNINFQIRLFETSNKVELMYGTCTAAATSVTCQVGLRGAASTDFNNRSSTTSWASTIAGTLNSSTITSTSTIVPASGLTFTWTPLAPCVPVYATFPLASQSFESWSNCNGTTDVPSNNWKNTPATGNNSWRRNDQGSSAAWSSTSGAYSPTFSTGTFSARFHSYDASSGTQGSLDLYINCSTGAAAKKVTFDYINTSGSDVLAVLLSTDGGTTFIQQGSNLTTSATWSAQSFSFTSTSATTVIRLRATSDFGLTDIGVDNLTVVADASAPLCATSPTAPTNAATGVAVTGTTLSWPTVSGATGYDVYFGSPSAVLVSSNQAGTTYATGALSASTTYSWRIVPKNANGDAIGCTTWTFTTATPPLCTTNISPANGGLVALSNTGGATLTWNAASGATSYDLYYGSANPPLSTILTNISGTTATITGITAGSTRYWYVVPKNSAGSATGCSSSTTSFNTACLNATSGLYPSTTFTPSCSGSTENIATDCYAGEYSNVSVVSGTNYTFSSSIGTDFITISNGTTTVLTTGTGSVNWTSTLTGTVRFYTHTNNTCGEASVNRTKSIQCAPVPPVCIANPTLPTNGATAIALTGTNLTWPSVSNATGYDVYFGTTNPATNLVSTNQAGTSFSTGVLSGSTTYYWSIVPRNSAGNAGTCSSWSFTTVPPPPANDICSGAVEISCGGSVTVDNTNATNDVLPTPTTGCTTSSNGLVKGIWFKVTPTNSGSVTVSTCATLPTTDTYLRVYEGNCGAFTTCMGFNDDACGALSTVTFTGVANTTYYILCGLFSATLGTPGPITITATCPIEAPVANNGSGCIDNFTASWSAVTDATSYSIDVSTSNAFNATNTNVAAWSFTTFNLQSDGGNANNTEANAKTLSTVGTSAISSVGSGATLAATASAWDGGSGLKYWQIADINTTGMYNLKLSNDQLSSGTGPRDFKVQYKIGAGGSWLDVSGGTITITSTTAFTSTTNLSLPSACDNQPSIFIRWIMTSNTSQSGGTVASGGTSRMSHIYVTGNTIQNFSVSAPATSLLISNLFPNTTYYYRVRAIGGGSTSVNSNIATGSVNTPPVITCPSNISVVNAAGQCGANVSFAATATATPAPSITYSQDPGTFFPVGVTTVTATATNSCGTTNCTFTVTVTDNIAPAITCPLSVTTNTDINQSYSTITLINATATDNCGTVTVTNNHSSSNQYPIGITSVTWTATDIAGNSSTCVQTIRVNDIQAPLISCGAPVTIPNIPGTCGADVTFEIPYAEDNSGFVTLTVIDKLGNVSLPVIIPVGPPVSGPPYPHSTMTASFPLGMSTLVWTATDPSGNQSQCTQDIIVVDNENPTITCPANISTNTDAGQCGAIVSFNATVTDNCTGSSVAQTSGINSGAQFPAGTSTVAFTATDQSGNNSTCSFTVTVTDVEAPNAICQDVTVQLDATGIGSTSSSEVNNGSNDACGIASLVLSQTEFNCSEVGLSQQTLTVTDVNGNISTCSTKITVEDNIVPVAVCQDITVQLDNSGFAIIVTEDIDNGSSDACGIVNFALSQTSFTCVEIGANPNLVTLTVTDINGNISTCSAKVIIEDVIAPIALCQDVTVQLDATGNGSTTPSAVDNGSSDACGIQSTSLDKTSFDCSNVENNNTVILTVTDVNGNLNTCSATVTVEDNIAPVAVCQDVIVNLDATGIGSTTVTEVNNYSSDACGIANLSLSKTSFNCSNVGSNSVTLTVTDENGNSSSCFATVTVVDGIAPVAVCQDVTVNLDATGNVSTTATVVDNGSSDACGIASLVLSQTAFNCTEVGVNPATLTLIDVNGNVSTCNTTITVVDKIAPVAVCQDVTVNLDATGNGSTTATAVDNGSNDACGIASLVLSQTAFNCTEVGANPEILTVTDVNGNVSTCATTVTVVDGIAPTALCQDVTVTLDATGNGSTTATVVDNGSSDACGIASLVLSQTAFNCTEVGANPEILTVTDNNGNISTCNTTVTVIDAIAPVALCQDVTVTLDATGNGSTTATAVDNGSSDACGVASLVLSQTSFNCTEVGANTEILTVTDVNGNVSTCIATVIVQDLIAPVAVCQDVTVNLDASGNGSTTATAVNSGSSDACGIASLVLSQTEFNCSEVGENPEILNVTDVNGNVSTCNTTVTVVDGIAPVAVCQDVTVNLNAGGTGTTTAIAVDNASSDACGIQSLSLNKTSFNCLEVGANSVILTVTDVNGNVSTCTAIVTVVDGIAPIALCKDVTVQLDVAGNGITNATAVDNGSSDACGIASLVLSQTDFVCSELGPNNETLTVTDVNGNVSTCTVIITVEDNVAPVATCQNVTVQLDNTGNGVTTAIAVNNGSTDACGLIPQCPPSGPMIACLSGLMLDKSTFDCSNVGENIVTLTVTDQHYNSSQCTAIVTVVDNEAPIAICQNVTVNLDAAGNGSTTATAVNNGSNDACGIASLVLSNSAFTCTNVGANPVTLTVTDVNGNVSTCSAVVTVIDGIAPVAVCQNVTVSLDASGNGSTTATAVNNGSSDACGIASLVLSNTAFTCTNVGSNPVTLTVTDVNGNVSTCNATVTVQDLIAPVAVCQDVTVSLDASGNGSTTATAVNNGSNDACGIASTVLSKTSFNCSNVGSNPVTLTVTDNNGNVSTCSATVTVQDLIAPVAVCQDVTVSLDAAGTGSTTATAINNGSNDACGIASLVLSKTSFNCSNVGSNPVILTVTDVNGNVSTCNATVTVQDLIAPIAICQNVTVSLDASGNGSTTATAVNNGSSDACGIASTVLSKTSFNCSNVGSNPVILTVTDVNGNVSTCNATVTVQDLIAPIAICQAVTVSLNAAGNGSTTAAAVNNGSSDACGIASLVLSKTSFNCSNVGSNPVILTVTDVNGNISTCATTVTVRDLIAPIALCKNVIVNLNAAGTASTTAAAVNNGSSDACGIASLALSKAEFNCTNVGANPVTLTVTDVNSNVSTCTATVTVVDGIAPTALCKNATVTLSGGTVSITPSLINNGSFDNCGIKTLSVSPTSYNCSNIGNNTATLTVTDVNNNVSTCTSTITVVGAVPTCSISSVPVSTTYTGGNPNIIYLGYGSQSTRLVSTVSGGSGFTYSWTGSNLSSNSIFNPVFTPTSAGTYNFTVTITNSNGCVTTCSITICVVDIRVPGTGGKKVYVCHSGPPSTPNTLEISVNAVGAHLAHGDYLGICGGNNTICSGLPLKNPTATPSTSLTSGTPNSSVDLTARVSSIKVSAFPNPFKDNATISFTLPEFSNNVRLSIFNLAGEDVRLLYDGSAEANVEYQFKVNEDNTMESGLYFYRLQTKEGKMVVNKLILQK